MDFGTPNIFHAPNRPSPRDLGKRLKRCDLNVGHFPSPRNHQVGWGLILGNLLGFMEELWSASTEPRERGVREEGWGLKRMVNLFCKDLSPCYTMCVPRFS